MKIFTTVGAGVRTALSALALLGVPALAAAQESAARWSVDPATSLVWWQLNPHHGHLWASTCPFDENWHPGEGRSRSYGDKKKLTRQIATTNRMQKPDEVPLFPRDTVKPVCRSAIRGQFTAADRASLKGVKGGLRVFADSLEIGSDMRQVFAQKHIYKTSLYREIGLTVDSVSGGQPGDTLRGTVHGIMRFRDAEIPVRAPFRGWADPRGLRIVGQWMVGTDELVDNFHIGRAYLSMGVYSQLWKELHMGFDLILRPEGSATDR